jgi:hypothetical protein
MAARRRSFLLPIGPAPKGRVLDAWGGRAERERERERERAIGLGLGDRGQDKEMAACLLRWNCGVLQRGFASAYMKQAAKSN